MFELQLFEKVEVEKPPASRSESAEIYLLGIKYLAPARIDPRILDIKHLFEASAQPIAKVYFILFFFDNVFLLFSFDLLGC